MERRAALVPCSLLDPRPAADAVRCPMRAAVNLPLAEIARRSHELPPRGACIQIPGRLAETTDALALLTGAGRRAEVSEAWQYEAGPSAGQVGRLWHPSEFLAEVLARLAPGRALDLGCGSGRDAVYMAALGWQVMGVDRLPDALERARDLASRCSVACEPIEWRHLDLRWPAPLAVGRQRFDLVVCVRFLHRPLLAQLRDWLNPGGQVVCEMFTAEHRRRRGKSASPAKGLAPGELPSLLRGLSVRRASEGWHGDCHVARVWATRAESGHD